VTNISQLLVTINYTDFDTTQRSLNEPLSTEHAVEDRFLATDRRATATRQHDFTLNPRNHIRFNLVVRRALLKIPDALREDYIQKRSRFDRKNNNYSGNTQVQHGSRYAMINTAPVMKEVTEVSLQTWVLSTVVAETSDRWPLVEKPTKEVAI
jgi:hypothetical protein